MVCAVLMMSRSSHAGDITYRSFSDSATLGPQAEAFAAKLASLSNLVLGSSNAIRFVKLSGIPPIPSPFAGNIVAAVSAGASRGGFDAAYVSGGELNKTWGFIYNSGVPFGPAFDEFTGFLYGKVVNGQATGLDLLQSILDTRHRNIVVIPIVASSEQLSGYFPLPIGNNDSRQPGIGLAGLCQQSWTLRFLPPGEYVIGKACDTLVTYRVIASKNIRFIAAVPGGGSLVEALKIGQLQGFEFATPLDDISQLFSTVDNPGTAGARFVHTPGWQQQFLVTWMIINKDVWRTMSVAQQALTSSVARDHVLSSYAENMQRQGDALRWVLAANRGDHDRHDDLVLSEWPERDLERLSIATNQILNERTADPSLPSEDRQDLSTILETLRTYVRSNFQYWTTRAVRSELRFKHWRSPTGDPWVDRKDPSH
jgi:TRAP-type mannitol/chloroaromatic compound transport system substrate-binding protein